MIILDMDSSESPTHGRQEGTAYNGHFGCSCYHPLFCFNQFGDLERSLLRRRTYASFCYQAKSWKTPRRVVAKVEWHPGELYPRLGFIVTNLSDRYQPYPGSEPGQPCQRYRKSRQR